MKGEGKGKDLKDGNNALQGIALNDADDIDLRQAIKECKTLEDNSNPKRNSNPPQTLPKRFVHRFGC